MWHSCGRYRLEDHFKGKDPLVREMFHRFEQMIRAFGPVTMYAEKTRIVFQVRVRFAGAVVRKHWLDCGFWLRRRVESSRFRKVEFIPPGYHLYSLRITDPAQFDGEVAAFLREAYALGCQQKP